MLAQKAESIEDGFNRCGKPCAFEYKYDGFRMLINKQESGEIKIFTRRLDDVTTQFPEVAEYIKKNIKAKSFILDSEAIGFDPKTKKYKPFEAISQRIRRKHNIPELIKKLPVEINAFDILYLDGKSLIDEPFEKRTRLLRKIIRPQKHKFRYSHQLITDNEKKAEIFYKAALRDNQEGVMIKNLKTSYKPGLRVGHMLKLKPAENELDLVIIGAEYGKGRRVGNFSSFILACKDEDGNLFEIGKASTGLKEKEELGLSYAELTRLLKPLIKKEQGRIVMVKPKIVVTIVYQNIQRSPTYDSGFALRFPRITQLRADRSVKDIATTKEIAADYNRYELKIHY
jgi:DNA ligase-1